MIVVISHASLIPLWLYLGSPTDGHGFLPGSAWFYPTIMLPHFIQLEYSVKKNYQINTYKNHIKAAYLIFFLFSYVLVIP